MESISGGGVFVRLASWERVQTCRATMLTALDYRYPPGHEPTLIAALRTWLSGWPGIGRIAAGMLHPD